MPSARLQRQSSPGGAEPFLITAQRFTSTQPLRLPMGDPIGTAAASPGEPDRHQFGLHCGKQGVPTQSSATDC